MKKIFEAKSLDNYLSQMDESAFALVEKLGELDEFGEHAFAACRAFIYEIIFKCIFGDASADCQRGDEYDDVITMFQQMADIINWKVRNLPLVMMVRAIPVVGDLLGRFVPRLQEELKLTKKRDRYIKSIVETARKNHQNGCSGADIASILIRAQESNQESTLTDKHIEGKSSLSAFLHI